MCSYRIGFVNFVLLKGVKARYSSDILDYIAEFNHIKLNQKLNSNWISCTVVRLETCSVTTCYRLDVGLSVARTIRSASSKEKTVKTQMNYDQMQQKFKWLLFFRDRTKALFLMWLNPYLILVFFPKHNKASFVLKHFTL